MIRFDEDRIRRVRSRDALIAFLRDDLDWPAPPDLPAQELCYDYSADELCLDPRAAERVQVQQLANFVPGQPWGVFLLETATPKLYATHLRRVLRGLAPTARSQRPDLPAWPAQNLLFIATHDYQQYTFAHFRGDQAATARLSAFGWERGDVGVRTLCEYNLPALAWPADEADADAWLAQWDRAFDVEAVTDKFFKEFRNLFEDTKRDLPKSIREPAQRHAFTQRLLNRLLFLCFLQKKRWLKGPNLPHPRATYLFDLFDEAVALGDEFYADYLHDLFFCALNRPPAAGDDRERDRLAHKLGFVPFLNGGLFDPADALDAPGAVALPNALFQAILGPDGLLRRYNFTVTESTPLNQEVAVDPEMLGKVFETVVLTSEEAEDYQAPNLRKATGSYYTPRIVVTFIVRETLQDYLTDRVPGLDQPRLARLMGVDAAGGLDEEARALLRATVSQAEAEAIRAQLDALRACDPAIGSGAFALGLLHEIVNLHLLCETVERGKDPRLARPNLVFDLKQRAIERNLYGVDLQGKAVEICKLRLWLSLIVDYQVDVDLDVCTEHQFERAIREIPALPNLSYKVRRGDALLDLVHDRPFRLTTIRHSEAMQDAQAALTATHRQFFGAQDPAEKRRLRLAALVHRTRLTRLQLEHQRAVLSGEQAPQMDMFDAPRTRAEIRRHEAALAELDAALAEVQQTEEALAELTARPALTPADDDRLTRLEAVSEGEAITFTWELDFPEVFASGPETRFLAENGFLSARGGFDLIVGNPPFVTARNPEKRALYRERWKETAFLKFQLVAPFFQRSFGLLRPGGHLGFIVSNAFAKREFGRPLVERFFPTVELRKVVDCSGLMFPGHGTPTCIVFGRNPSPGPSPTRGGESDSSEPGSPFPPREGGQGVRSEAIRIAATLPGGGDLRTPPERSPLWAALQAHHDQPGHRDDRIMVADRPRAEMAKWPWNLDVSAEPTRKQLEKHPQKLEDLLDGDIGVCTMTNADDIFTMPDDQARRLQLPTGWLRIFQEGDAVRDWALDSDVRILVPYDENAEIIRERKLERAALAYLKPYKSVLANRLSFGNKTFEQLGREWYAFERMNANKYRTPQFITFGEIATHAHFVYWSEPRIFERDSPVIKLPPSASPDDHHLLAGLLNSSAALFWLKQVCFNKGAGDEEERDRFVYAGGKVQQLPIPAVLLTPGPLRERLTALARACWERGQQAPALAYRKLFERPGEAYHAWNSALAGWVRPWSVEQGVWRDAEELRAAWAAYRAERERLRGEMIALQEEMDWLVYAAYGLLGKDDPSVGRADGGRRKDEYVALTADGQLHPSAFILQPLHLGERPFELLRDNKPIPAHFSPERRALWEARQQAIRENEHLQRLEQPVYKRRWYRKDSDEQEFRRAGEWWLLEKAEWWLEHQAGGGPVALEPWAAALWADERVRAAVAVCSPPPPGEGPGVGAFIRLFKSLVAESTVPDWIPPALPWEQVEKKNKDRKTPARARAIRGKLNVPRERFRLTQSGLGRAAEGLYVWAGKDRGLGGAGQGR